MSRGKRKRKTAAERKRSRLRVRIAVELLRSEPVMDAVTAFVYEDVRARVEAAKATSASNG